MSFNNPTAVAALLDGDMANALAAATPGGIARQEAQGQQTLVASEMLPKQINGATREQLTAIGFVFGDDVDELFVNCTLPPGWTKRATVHPMHSHLLDDKGRKRAGIFYKAAFYDRNADMTMSVRYGMSLYENGSSADAFRVIVRDGDAAIHELGEWKRPDYAEHDRLQKACTDWLDEKYPDWRNTFAYWD